jgi:flagellar motor switch protein FliM
MPVFRGTIGTSDGNYAVKVQQWLQHRKRKPLSEFIEEAEQYSRSRELH